MSGWLWVLGGLVGWLLLAAGVSFVLGALLRATDRRERRDGLEARGRRDDPRDERDWPEAG